MSEPENTAHQPPSDYEQKGLVTEVIVPLASPVLGGAVTAAVNHHLNKPKDPPKDK